MSALILNQTTDRVALVRPATFGFNAETAASNRFQQGGPTRVDASARAAAEFEALARALGSEGVDALVLEDTPEPRRPDAVFPNNWMSWHEDGTLVLYPMLAPNRRLERRDDFIERIAEYHGFPICRTLDFTHHEKHGRYLEGTGSLVLDHRSRVAYACRSSRTDERLVHEWCEALGYEAFVFDAIDEAGSAYYHTNVVLSIGTRHAVIAAECVPEAQRGALLERLGGREREVIAIDRREVAGFGGNLLELAAWDEALGDCSVLVMSASAHAALSPRNQARLAASVDTVLAVPVPVIEEIGGGSVRCMIAEVFLPSP